MFFHPQTLSNELEICSEILILEFCSVLSFPNTQRDFSINSVFSFPTKTINGYWLNVFRSIGQFIQSFLSISNHELTKCLQNKRESQK